MRDAIDEDVTRDSAPLIAEAVNAALRGQPCQTPFSTLEQRAAEGLIPAAFANVVRGAVIRRQGLPDEALTLYESSVDEFFRRDMESELIFVCNEMGQLYRGKKDFARAIQCYNRALEGREELLNATVRSTFYNNIGNCYGAMCEHDRALEYCLKALNLREEAGDKKGIASCHLNLGEIYSRLEDPDKAIASLQVAAEIYSEQGNEVQLSKVQNTLGIVLFESGRAQEAVQPLLQSLALKEKHGQPELLHNTLHSLGRLYIKLGDHNKAREFFRRCADVRRQLGDEDGLAGSLRALAEVEALDGRLKEALVMYLEASRLPIRRKDVQLEVHAGLADTYARLGEFEKAYTHHMEAWKLYEDIFREERAAKIAEMQARFDLESKEREARIYRQKNEELTQKNRLIEEQKVRIEQTLAELRKSEMSLDWVHDRLQEVVGRSIVGQSKEMKAVLELVGKVARAENTTVMIIGESGTGKELIAKAIHDASNRARCFFHAVNSSAISSTLFESEFFGHEKGAFTGAEQAKPGWFEVANGGTLFLDEIGFMPVEQQIKLLRVLEERNVIRVGARNQIAVNVRVISATNQNLARLVEEGKFREDLYHRLAAFVIHIPPLRERKADIAPLWEHYVGKFCVAMNKSIRRIEPTVFDLLEHHPFPGNVRELRNMAERAVILCDSQTLQPRHLDLHREKPGEPVAANLSLAALEEQAVRRALDFAGGNQARAARMLGLTAKSLERRLTKYGIPTKRQM